MKKRTKVVITNIVLFLVILTSIFIIVKYYKNSIKEEKIIKEQERYNEILNSFTIAVHKYIDVTFVIRDHYNCSHYVTSNITSDNLISNGYLNVADMLDIDNINTCKGVASTSLDDNCNMQYEIDISCKNFQTPDFENRNYSDFTEWKD